MGSKGTGLNKRQDEWGEDESPATTEHTCLICGCTDAQACEGGCYWVLPGICSKCLHELVPECIGLLVEVIMETHKAEIDVGHHGDDECCVGKCTTCDLIKAARNIEAALERK